MDSEKREIKVGKTEGTQPGRINAFIHFVKQCAAASGFEIIDRIAVKDTDGRVWR